MLRIRFHQDTSCPDPAEHECGWTHDDWTGPRGTRCAPDPPGIGMRRKLATGCAWLVMDRPGDRWASNDPEDWDEACGLLTIIHDNNGARNPAARALDVSQVLRTWNTWAKGECYGYTVESTTDGSVIDSCWGYVGEDSWPYMADDIVAAILHEYGRIPDLDFGGDDGWVCEREVYRAIRRENERRKAAA